MATRFVPKYIYAPGWGWYFPKFGSSGGVRARDRLQPPFGGYGMYQPPVRSVEGKLEDSPTQTDDVGNPGAAPGESSTSPEASKQPAVNPFPTKKFKILGFFLSLMSSTSISFGLSNVIITAMVIVQQPNWGCLAQPYSSSLNSLDPSNPTMQFVDWLFITVGLWASISVFVAANLAGSIKQALSPKSKIFAVFALLSVFIFLPITFIFTALDSALSYSCRTDQAVDTKFIMPVMICILSGLEIGLTIFIFTVLRKEVLKAPQPPTELTSETTPTPTPTPKPISTPSSSLVTPKQTPSDLEPLPSQWPGMSQPIGRFSQQPYGPPPALPPLRQPISRPIPPNYYRPAPMMRPEYRYPPQYPADRRAVAEDPYRRPYPPRYYPRTNFAPRVSPTNTPNYRNPNLGVSRDRGIFGNAFVNNRMPSMNGGEYGPNLAYKYYP